MKTLARTLKDQEDRLLNCVHCGFCLPACPTYDRLGDEADSPRGRLHLMRAVVDGRLDASSDAFQTHIDRCLGCRACEPVCPSGVEYGSLLELARQEAIRARPPGFFTRGLLALLERPRALGAVLLGSRLFRGSGVPALGVRALPSSAPFRPLRFALAMLAASAGSRRFIRGEGGVPAARRQAGAPSGPQAAEPAGEVAVLTGCVQDGLFRRVNQATVRVLRANGFFVRDVPTQRCCGALHAHAGELDRARALARTNIMAFEASGVRCVAVNAAGCGATMKEYGHLLEGDPDFEERARRFSQNVKDISELIVERPLRRGAALPTTVAYDAPCHLLHAQRVAEPPLQLLRAIPGLRLVPLAKSDECCGGAGIYGITHPELGGSIGADKVAAVRESGAAILATGNPGCMMQIGAGLRMGGLPVDVRHPVELLDESYRRAGFYRHPHRRHLPEPTPSSSAEPEGRGHA